MRVTCRIPQHPEARYTACSMRTEHLFVVSSDARMGRPETGQDALPRASQSSMARRSKLRARRRRQG